MKRQDSENSNPSNPSSSSKGKSSYVTNVEIIELRSQLNQMQLMIIQAGYRELDTLSQLNHLKCQIKDSQDYNLRLCQNIQHYGSIIAHQNNIIKDLQHKYYSLYNQISFRK
jgi:hypothetical protein